MAEKKKFVVVKKFHEKKDGVNKFYAPRREDRAVLVTADDFEATRWKELVDGGFVEAADAKAIEAAEAGNGEN